jgi:hypothetical protein
VQGRSNRNYRVRASTALATAFHSRHFKERPWGAVVSTIEAGQEVIASQQA